jgi:hypothetical protein
VAPRGGARVEAVEQRNRAESARADLDDQRRAAEAARDALAAAQGWLAAIEYGRTMQVTDQELRDNNTEIARALLDGTQPHLRGWEWHYLRRMCDSSLLTLRGHAGEVWSVAFSPDGTRIVTGSADKTANLWDAKTGADLLTLRGPLGEVRAASFSRDGARVVIGDQFGQIIV